MELEIIRKESGQSMGQWVYGVLRGNIIKLHLVPGLAMTEVEIADQLHTSRTPVREAFIRLVEDGLLEIYPQKGSFVSLIDIQQAEEACFVRRVLTKAILKEACEYFPEDCLFDLSANLTMQTFCKTQQNYEKMFDLDNEFHQILYRGSGKERIWLQIRKMNGNFDRLRMLRLFVSKFSWDKIIDEHHELTQLVIHKNSANVDKMVDKHLKESLFDGISLQNAEYFKQDIRQYL